jgi:hypothetical protein
MTNGLDNGKTRLLVRSGGRRTKHESAFLRMTKRQIIYVFSISLFFAACSAKYVGKTYDGPDFSLCESNSLREAIMAILRDRMIEEMKLRNFSPATQQSYVYAVSRLAKYHHQSPDQLSKEDIRAFPSSYYFLSSTFIPSTPSLKLSP